MDRKELTDYLTGLPDAQLYDLKELYNVLVREGPSKRVETLAILEPLMPGSFDLMDALDEASAWYAQAKFDEKPWARLFGDTYLGMIQYQKLKAEGRLGPFTEELRSMRRRIAGAILSLPAFQPDKDELN